MRSVFFAILSVVLLSSAALAESPLIGIRAGVGTDINGGAAFGGGLNFLLELDDNALELGVIGFGGSFEETTEEAINTYEETTDIWVFGALANYLVGYEPGYASRFFVVGVGLASVGIEWEERSATDTSLGTPLAGGGSKQAEDATGGGFVFNLGGGMAFENGFDLRLEFATIMAFSAPGEATAVVPTVMLTAGVRF